MVIRELLTRFGADSSGFVKGAAEVKTQLTALNKDFYTNQKAMKSVNDELKALEKEQKEFDKLIKDGVISKQSKEYQENAQKIDALNLKKAQLKTNEQQIKAEISKTTAEMKEQSDATIKNKAAMEQFGQTLKKVATGYFAIGTALFAFTGKMANNADEINTAAKKYGMATDEIQKFAYSADIIDVEADTVYGAMSKMVKNMATAQKGTGDAANAFKALGVEIQSNGQLLNKMDVWGNTISALGKMENETQRDAYAMQIFGKSAMELNPLILGGADALKQLGDEAERNGLILSQEKLDKLNAYNDKIDTFKAKLQQTAMAAGSEAVDAFDELFDSTDEVVGVVKDLIVGTSKLIGFTIKHKDLVIALATAYGTFKVAMSIGTLISGVVGAVRSLSAANQAATATQLVLNNAVKANPYVMLASVLLSAVSAIGAFAFANKNASDSTYVATDTIKEEATSLADASAKYELMGDKASKTASDKLELINIQKQLTGEFGVEAGSIDLVNGKYDQQKQKLDALKKSKLEELQSQQIDDVNKATDKFTTNTNKSVSGTYRDIKPFARDTFDNIDNLNFKGDSGTKSGEVYLNFEFLGDAAQRYKAASETLEKLKSVGITTGEVYSGVTDRLRTYKSETEALVEALKGEIETSEKLDNNQERVAENKVKLQRLYDTLKISVDGTEEQTKQYVKALEILSKTETTEASSAQEKEIQKTKTLSVEIANRLNLHTIEIASIQSVADANLALADMEKQRYESAISINSYQDSVTYGNKFGAGTDYAKLKGQIERIKSIYADLEAAAKKVHGSTSSVSKAHEASAKKTQDIAKKEISYLELAATAYKKISDSKIAAIDKEIAAKQKLMETNEKQKEIDRVNYELKNSNGSQLDEFSRLELTKKRDELVKQQKDTQWLDSMNAKKQKLLDAQTYASNIFSSAKGSTPSAQSIVNNNSTQANFNLVSKGATAGQIAKAVYDKLMKGLAV